MAKYLLGQRQTSRHQERWPVNRVETDNILADQMQAGGPVFPPFLRVVGKANARNISDQRVEPNIHDMVFTTRNLHAPIEAGPRHRKVTQAAFDEAQRFVAPAFGPHEIGVRGVKIQQWLLIFGKAEKPGFLGRPFHRRTLRGKFNAPFPVDQLAFIVKGFITHAIPAFIPVEIEVSTGLQPLPDRLAGAVMFWRGRAFEMIN